MYTSNNNIFSKRILLFFFFFFFYFETQQHQTKIVERYSIRSYAHSPKCFTPLEITNASPSLGKSHARGKEARISPLGLKSKIGRHRFLAHVANDPATKVSRINEWQRRYKRRGKNPGEQPGLISQAKQDRRARTLMKTNRDDVRGTHAAIYSSTNGLARVSPPLFLPPRIGRIVAPREKNPFDGNTNGRKRRRIASALWGIRMYPSCPPTPPLLSSPRKGSAFFRRTRWDLAKKRRTPIRLRETGISPSLSPVFPSSARHAHPLRPYVRAHSAGIFQRNARARTPFRESWRENESRDAGGSGGRGPGCACRVV